jgi:hypothetical protein
MIYDLRRYERRKKKNVQTHSISFVALGTKPASSIIISQAVPPIIT